MYKEIATEKKSLDFFGISNQDGIKILNFHDFRSKIADQGMNYKPKNLSYPGDSKMRDVTRLTLKRRCMLKDSTDGKISVRSIDRPEKTQKIIDKMTESDYKKIIENKGNNNRFCGDLTRLMHHQCKTITDNNNGRNCAFCGEISYTRCYACPNKPYLHCNPRTGKFKGRQ